MRKIASLLVLAASLTAVACGSSDTSPSEPTTSGSGGSGGGSNSGGGGNGGSGGGDGGAAPIWSQLGLDGSVIHQLAVDSARPERIFAGISPGGDGTGFHRSTDRGETWPAAPGLPSLYASGLAASPLQSIILANPGVEGGLRSTDGGDSWTPVFADPGNANDIAFDPLDPTLVWVTDTNKGVSRSKDGGVTWMYTPNTGLPLGMQGIGSIVSDGSKLFVAAGAQGVFVSSDDGDSFTQASAGLPVGKIEGFVNTLAAHSDRPGFVLAQTTSEGLYRSDNSGATWTKIDLGSEMSRFLALAIDPKSPTTLYVGHSNDGAHPGGLLRSTDDGATWSPIGPDGIDMLVLAFDPDDDTVYAGTLGSGVWRFGVPTSQ